MRWLAFITLMLPLVGSAAEPLGRLFYTPQQRATLDSARRQNIKVDVVTETSAPPENISVNGVINRSDGQSTVWINNRPLNEKRAPNGITIVSRSADNASVTLHLPQSSRNVDLKVGQNLDATNGQIQESYQRPHLPSVIRKKIVSIPAPRSVKSKSGISSKEADNDEVVSESPPQTDEQSAKPSPPQPSTVQY